MQSIKSIQSVQSITSIQSIKSIQSIIGTKSAKQVGGRTCWIGSAGHEPPSDTSYRAIQRRRP